MVRTTTSNGNDDDSLAASNNDSDTMSHGYGRTSDTVDTTCAPTSPPWNDADATNDDGDDDEEEEEMENYETSYAKLQKLRRKYGASDAALLHPDNAAEDTRGDDGESPPKRCARQRRRRGGYGSSNLDNAASSSSVLEALHDDDREGVEATAGAAADDTDYNGGIDSWNLEDLDIVDEDMLLDEEGGSGGGKADLFLEEDVDLNGDDDDDDDDATRPYDDRSGCDDDDDNEEEARRGRTRKMHEGIDAIDEVDQEKQQPPADEHEPSNEDINNEKEVATITTTSAINPTNKQILSLVDKLFQAADTDNMTVGGVLSFVAEHFGFKDKKALGKERKNMIKERLTLLINQKGEGDDEMEDEKKAKRKKKKKERSKRQEENTGEKEEGEETYQYSDDGDLQEEEEGDDAGGNDSSSDYEEKPTSKKKMSTKSRKKKSITDNDDDSDLSDNSDVSLSKKRSSSRRTKRRSNGPSKKGKMKNHLRDEATKRRIRQMEEARIRQEELGHLADDDINGDAADDSKSNSKKEEEKANAGPQLSEQDRQRAMAIAARFDTNREELRIKREEDRVGLIGKLRQRRLESITSKDFLEETKKRDILAVESNKDEKEEKKNDVEDEGSAEHANAPEDNDGREFENNDGMIELDDDSDDGGDEDSDDELEVAAPNSSSLNIPATKSKQKSSVFDSLLKNHGMDSTRRPIVGQKKSKSLTSNPRMALRMVLREKQVKAGNRWLARELGYKTEEDHIRDCKDVEDKKRKQIFLLEKEAAVREEKNIGREADIDEEEELHFHNIGATAAYDEEDDEMAMARELNQLEEVSNSDDSLEERIDDTDEQNMNALLQSSEADQSDVVKINDAEGQPSLESLDTFSSSPADAVPEYETTVVSPTTSNNVDQVAVICKENVDSDLPVVNSDNRSVPDVFEVSKLVNEPKDAEKGAEESESIGMSAAVDCSSSPIEPEKSGPKKTKNSIWQAMLRKEKEDIAKQKRRQKRGGGLVEGEAEEEEEEEGIVGLEDFGFAVQKKTGDDDDDVDDAEVDEDDLEHVVDDLSDGEGDEEAGEAARKRLEAKEEKERHKEIMRRMREGYGGRDRGIASGIGGARGMHRFDVLVGADNRDEAKQLGLLNDDELDSDDEAEGKPEKKDDEEEDEAALLDKMLKERFLHKQTDDTLEENFSEDDEEGEDEDDGSGENKNGDDDEDKEQDRVAKRFAKRARMNRILEAYEGDNQFSRSRLIDEDESTQNDLKAIKTSLSRKRGIISIGDKNKEAKENSNDSSKRLKGGTSDSALSGSRFLMNKSSLSVALIANRNAGRMRKTTFLNGKQANSFGRKSSTCSSKSVSLNHVVFMAGESQTFSRMDSSSNSFMKSVKKSTSLIKQSSKHVSRGSSLWSKVCAKNFS